MKSIRSYLLIYLLSALLVGTSVIGIFTYINTRIEVNELYDEHFRQLARVILYQQNKTHDITPNTQDVPEANKGGKLNGEEEYLIQVWTPSGKLIYSSHPNISFPMVEGADVQIVNHSGQIWKSYALSSTQWVVEISQPLHARAELIREIGLNNLIPVLAQIPLLSLLIWLAIGRSLVPFEALSAAIRNRKSGTSEKIELEKSPVEVKALVEELNGFIQRQSADLQRQRQFTSDAAHELRTPLAAVQLQADLLARMETLEERREANLKLRAGVERAAYLINQLLTMARLEPGSETPSNNTGINLSPLIQKLADLQHPMASQKDILLKTNLDPALKVMANADTMGIALNSILDNAVRYTQIGGTIAIRAYAEGGSTVVQITDTGPGIPASEWIRVFDRFYRIAGTEGPGTGLGLAIARTIIENHHGRIALDNNPEQSGLQVTIHLPS